VLFINVVSLFDFCSVGGLKYHTFRKSYQNTSRIYS